MIVDALSSLQQLTNNNLTTQAACSSINTACPSESLLPTVQQLYSNNILLVLPLQICYVTYLDPNTMYMQKKSDTHEGNTLKHTHVVRAHKLEQESDIDSYINRNMGPACILEHGSLDENGLPWLQQETCYDC